MQGILLLITALALQSGRALAEVVPPGILDACPGYTARNVRTSGGTLTADLVLAGKACNVFGEDIKNLKLQVTYETKSRLHLKITDASAKRFEVPDFVLPRPSSNSISPRTSDIVFNYTTSPFSFSIHRASAPSAAPLFSTGSHPLIFEPQYIRLKTSLPNSPNLYGLGEHTDSFRLPTHNYTRTLWTRDAYGIPQGTNLYSSHPVYYEHRLEGTHGVFMLNANGMDVKIDDSNGASLEYNMIGGVIDMYFLAGPDPIQVSKQYSEIVGKPAEVPYWGFGVHQCRFGYKDFVDVSQVITNYSAANIPLETMWTDIDYMDRRLIFTVDPNYFPMPRVREIVDYLHEKGQRYILMTDPAVGYNPADPYPVYKRGKALDLWLKRSNGSDFFGLVWPGVVVYPDWFHPKIEQWWTDEFKRFYSPTSGVDIDGAWIDMNEPASFCNFPCENPFQQAIEQNLPPPRVNPPPDPNTPIFGRPAPKPVKRAVDEELLLFPPYDIENAAGGLSNKTAHTNVVHANGLTEYDAHNLYGTLMSMYTQRAMSARRPGKRTLIITRSTFAGAGAHVGKWLGDNLSLWEHYRFSIAGMLGMASIYQVPMVGSDICGFGGNTTETLCARWAMLGAFYPFMRNHNGDTSISQEFYRWPITAEAARNAITIRYRLLDYIYTAFHRQHVDGTPLLNPLWYKYPKDPNTFGIDLQFFYGPSILVSPVTQENSTSVDIYLPKDIFYDASLAPVQGQGATVSLTNVSMTEIPLHIKGGSIIPFRIESAMTTNELRKKDFEFVVAIGSDGKATGELYIDDGESVVVRDSLEATMSFERGRLTVAGKFGYRAGVKVTKIRFLGVASAPKQVEVNGRRVNQSSWTYEAQRKGLDVTISLALDKGFTVNFA